MKKFFFISIIFSLTHGIIGQNYQDKINNIPFGIGILGGINTSNFTGTSFVIEGRINLIPDLNSKMSIGYSTIYEKDGSHINTHGAIDLEGINQYSTVSYDIDRFRYTTVPISVGLEYIFTRQTFSPYTTFEFGYNYYDYKTEEINYQVGKDGYYDNFDELPEIYKNEPSKINKEDESFRFAFGVGTLYNLSSKIFLDLRYAYQVNTALVNTHQFLIGIQL
ncbi:MAG: hypothetical protein WAR79_17620 [Melioribacteraceae bacterium]